MGETPARCMPKRKAQGHTPTYNGHLLASFGHTFVYQLMAITWGRQAKPKHERTPFALPWFPHVVCEYGVANSDINTLIQDSNTPDNTTTRLTNVRSMSWASSVHVHASDACLYRYIPCICVRAVMFCMCVVHECACARVIAIEFMRACACVLCVGMQCVHGCMVTHVCIHLLLAQTRLCVCVCVHIRMSCVYAVVLALLY